MAQVPALLRISILFDNVVLPPSSRLPSTNLERYAISNKLDYFSVLSAKQDILRRCGQNLNANSANSTHDNDSLRPGKFGIC